MQEKFTYHFWVTRDDTCKFSRRFWRSCSCESSWICKIKLKKRFARDQTKVVSSEQPRNWLRTLVKCFALFNPHPPVATPSSLIGEKKSTLRYAADDLRVTFSFFDSDGAADSGRRSWWQLPANWISCYFKQHFWLRCISSF